MLIASFFVTAWGYQVFWNNLVLNIWQLFTTVDVINTMKISYGVFFAIVVAISLVYNPKAIKSHSEGYHNLFDAYSNSNSILIENSRLGNRRSHPEQVYRCGDHLVRIGTHG